MRDRACYLPGIAAPFFSARLRRLENTFCLERGVCRVVERATELRFLPSAALAVKNVRPSGELQHPEPAPGCRGSLNGVY